MKRIFITTMVIGSLFYGCTPDASEVEHSDPAVFLQDMADILGHMKTYTLAVYDTPHDSLMDFRPSEDVMSFEEHTAHVLANMYVQFEYFVKVDTTTSTIRALEESAEILAITDREELRQRLVAQFDEVIEHLRKKDTSGDWNKPRLLPQFPGKPEKDLMTVLMLMRDHITHHRAEMVVYLRLMGYKPPQYVPF